MPRRHDGTTVAQADALRLWASAAFEKLKAVAHSYNSVITYKELATHVKDMTGVETDQLITNWIGKVLEIVAEDAVDSQEPPLTSLCLHANGTIGEGYRRAPKSVPSSMTTEIEELAAEHRLLCYQRYATDLPAGGGIPTLTPEVAIRRRKSITGEDDTEWLAELLRRGAISAHDRIPFHNHLQVALLFGRTYKAHQSATIRLDDRTQVWFPKMYSNGDWNNSLSADGAEITMSRVTGGKYGGVMETEPIREYVITFGHVKPQSGPRYYEFLGVFEGAPQLSNNTKWVHQIVADTIYFDGNGEFSFEPSRTRPIQDDQTAEAADVDPKLVATYQSQLDSGSFAVEDRTGSSKTRGSAQAVFAKAVKDNYGWSCAVTGIKTKAFLVASHIVPWSADMNIRIDPSNGICLSTFVDRAFDSGYLLITPEGRTSVRWEKIEDDPILASELKKIDDVEIGIPAKSPPDPAKLARRVELGY